MAWEGDTVFSKHGSERWRKEAFGDLNQQLNRVGANVIICQFGKMESLQGKIGLKEFWKYESLIDLLSLIIES